MTIKAKLWTSYLVILALLVLCGALVQTKVSSIRQSVDLQEDLGRVSMKYSEVFGQLQLRMVLFDPKGVEEVNAHIERLDVERKDLMDSLRPHLDKQSLADFDAAEEARVIAEEGVDFFMEKIQKGWEDSGDMQDFLIENQRKQLTAFEHIGAVNERLSNKIRSDLQNTLLFLAVAFLVVAGIVIGVAAVIPRAIVNPINRLVGHTEKVAHGDLRVSAERPSRDELGRLTRSFDTMVKNLRGLVTGITEASEKLSSLGQELTHGSEETKGGAEQIMHAIEEVTTSSEKQNMAVTKSSETLLEFSTLIQGAAREAEAALEVSQETRKVAQTGREVVAGAERKMNEIRRIVENSAEAIKNLGERGNQITDITRLITTITEQTDLLALNAAVEAARAGEQGQGFDVVASEVRKLAERSANAALEISDIIEVTQREISEAIHWMQEGTSSVVEGTSAMRETGQSFQQIAEFVDKTVDQINVISQTTRDKIATSDEIIRVISQVAEASESNMAVVQEVYATTSEQIASLKSMLDHIKTVNVLTDELKKEIVKFTL